MPGGKGKSTGGKAGPKEAAGKSQKSHSAKAGLQVSLLDSDCCVSATSTVFNLSFALLQQTRDKGVLT